MSVVPTRLKNTSFCRKKKKKERKTKKKKAPGKVF